MPAPLAEGVHKDVKTAIAIARKFNNEVLRPIYLEHGPQVHGGPRLPRLGILKKAGEWGLFSLFIPKLFGGRGLNFLACIHS